MNGSFSGRYSTLMLSLGSPQPASSCAPSQSEPHYLLIRRDQNDLAQLEANMHVGALTPVDAIDTALLRLE